MSVDPGGLESGSDPQDPVLDFDEESTLDDNELLDPIDENDNDKVNGIVPSPAPAIEASIELDAQI